MPVNLKTLLFFAILWVAVGTTVCAQATSSTLDRILPAVSTPSPANLRDAEAAFKVLEPGAADVLTQYGMALALAANNRYPQAFDVVESIPPQVQKSGPFRRLRIWLAVKLKKDELAQLSVQDFIDELKTRSVQEPTTKDLEDVQFAGKLVYYLSDIAEREAPLQPAQAKAWRQALEGLPASWKKELQEIEAFFIASRDKRLAEARDNFGDWQMRTKQSLQTAQQKVAAATQDEAAAKAQWTQAQDAQKAFLAMAQPQLQMLQGEEIQLTRDRAALPRPNPPSKPRKDKDGKVSAADQREYDRDKDKYDDRLRDYNQKIGMIDSRLTVVRNDISALLNKDEAMKQEVNFKKGAHQKTLLPLQIASKNEARIKEVLADRPVWDSPTSLAAIRALDGYLSLDGAREVARIEAARKR